MLNIPADYKILLLLEEILSVLLFNVYNGIA